jgi:iron complex outermembrane recepter protein
MSLNQRDGASHRRYSPRARSRLIRLAFNLSISASIYISIFAPGFAFADDAFAATQLADEQTKKLGVITVLGTRPSSLPTNIPTTIEGISAADIAEKINATDAQDALKYFPSLLVRKRYIGDFDHAVLASRASGTGNSARSLVYADGILLSNLLGNGASFTPRWGLVAPEEIERVDVLYGPFSAAYSGNSVGAVVDYVTRMPTQFVASVKAGVFTQRFAQYGTNARYSGNQLNVTLGNKHDAFSWWLSLNRLDSDGHPIVFSTKLISQGTAMSGGIPVTGAVPDRNPRNQDWLITGATNQINTRQENVKVKLAYDFSPSVRATYVFGLWNNDAKRYAETYLKNVAGADVFSGNVAIDGRQYIIAANEIAPSQQDLRHIIHGLTLKSNTRGEFDWEASASAYDYDKDLSRTPASTLALPAAEGGGAGRIADLNGTGWNTFALKGIWRPAFSGDAIRTVGGHLIDFGFQFDRYKLRSTVSDTPDWLGGIAAARVSAFQGNSSLQSFYAQDTWRIADSWRSTIGLRAEQWKASNGAISNAASTQLFAGRSVSSVSPKLALAYLAAPDWVLKASLGRAVRYPTVSELYQGSISSNVVVNNDPDLKAEKSWTGELTAERAFGDAGGGGSIRTTVFFENTKEALYSQTNVTVFPNVTNIQNVDQIRTKGLELSLNLPNFIWRGFDVISSYTFADSRIVKNGKFPASVDKWQPRVPRHRANLLVTWRANKDLSTTLGVRYSGTQYGTLDNADANGATYTGVSSFTVADLRIQYKWDKRWTFAAGVDNLNNRKYWAFHPYPHRTFLADAKWTF